MALDRNRLVAAWLDARRSDLTLRTPSDLALRQARLWHDMEPVLARTPAIAGLAGQPLDRFPVMSPETLRADFDRWNTAGLTLGQAEAAARRGDAGGSGEVRPGLVAGFSSGSSGRPGLFVSDPKERGSYLGHVLARLLPLDVLFRPTRIALCLRADNRLYGDVVGAGLFRFLFVGLGELVQTRIDQLRDFAPQILIAPSHVLAELARQPVGAHRWPLQRLFYGAEPMGEAERTWIAASLGIRPDPIYQATEGFIGATCRFGTLHLNEDVLIIERDPVPRTNRFVPIVTDLRRTTQPMIRVRLPDLLEPLQTSCRCGSPLTAVRPVEGRLEDLWRWSGATITPREVESAISGALGPEREWRATASSSQVRVEAGPDQREAARAALAALLTQRGLTVPVVDDALTPGTAVKRRRVRWTNG